MVRPKWWFRISASIEKNRNTLAMLKILAMEKRI
jgi:hypothetical protein